MSPLHSTDLAALPPHKLARLLDTLSEDDAATLLYDWEFWARPSQLAPPGNWFVWLILAGRGWGKTRSGAEWVRTQVESGRASRVALVARTSDDARKVMVEGPSGILAVSPPWFMPTYEPSRRQLIWPNGAIATTYSSENPDQLRGPQHDAAWGDELAAWHYDEAWDQLLFGLRLGTQPQVVVTTTPRPTRLIRRLAADPNTVVTRGTTYENRAFLSEKSLAYLIEKYEGTRLGRQELHAEILDDVPGALWRRDEIEQHRLQQAPPMKRIVVAIDPAAASTQTSAETGIVVVGISLTGEGMVLADESLRGTPHQWASAAVRAYHHWAADQIIAEVNNGGEMVEHTLRTVERTLPITLVRASRDKQTRAQPVAALYEQGRVHHVGRFPLLEDQLCTWVIGETSPDRLDALVWGLTALMIQGPPTLEVAQNPFYR